MRHDADIPVTFKPGKTLSQYMHNAEAHGRQSRTVQQIVGVSELKGEQR